MDHGDFITVKSMSGVHRIRAEQILSYSALDQRETRKDEPICHFILSVHIHGMQALGLPFATQEDMDKAAGQLDWIFQKEKRKHESEKKAET
jgi:hypothetical protein